jgi:hypothetical protein
VTFLFPSAWEISVGKQFTLTRRSILSIIILKGGGFTQLLKVHSKLFVVVEHSRGRIQGGAYAPLFWEKYWFFVQFFMVLPFTRLFSLHATPISKSWICPWQWCTILQLSRPGLWNSSSSAFALAWWNYSARSITPPRFYERFCVPLRLGANWELLA